MIKTVAAKMRDSNGREIKNTEELKQIWRNYSGRLFNSNGERSQRRKENQNQVEKEEARAINSSDKEKKDWWEFLGQNLRKVIFSL